ncbi:MAG: dihydropteroate synthase [Chloroflexi bacterium]|nr:dihydropteroate synthase [Chloroflexota bacterium]
MIIQKNKLMWNSKPYIMGIVNVTPDSFSGDGIMGNNEGFLNLGFEKALGMEKDGADIIDVGGESTRPKHIYQGAQSISANEEMERVLPLLEKLKNNLAIPISIDTQKGVVAKYALQSGAKIINDVSMMSDDVMVETLIKYKPIYILSHHRKTKHSTDIINDIYLDLDEKIQFLLSKNFPMENIIIDPGIGFGKNSEQSFYIIKNLKKLISRFNIPLMIGTSKKSFLENITGETLDNRDIGTYISNFFSLLNGSYIVRVHDVMNTKKIVDFYKQIEKI